MPDPDTTCSSPISSLHNAGFADAYCVWANYRFMISAGTGGSVSSITACTDHSGTIGTDISGLTINGNGHAWMDLAAGAATIHTPGLWMDCADNAIAYGYSSAEMATSGVYIRSNDVNIVDSLISENAYALIFDSCQPETLLYNNITDNTGTGL